MNLLNFLANLMNQPEMQAAFNRDPEALMKQAALSEVQRELLWHHDADGIGKEIAKEFHDFESCLRMPWPSSSIKVMSVTPGQGMVGETVQVKVEGLFFDTRATCTLNRGQDRVEGQIVPGSVQSDFRSSLLVTFDLAQGALPGRWDVEVANDDEHYDALPLTFEILAADAAPAPAP